MRTSHLRAGIALVSLFSCTAGATLVACSGSGATGGDVAADASEAAPLVEAGGHDSTSPSDATGDVLDAPAEGESGSSGEAGGGDTGAADTGSGDADAGAAGDACVSGEAGEPTSLACAHLYSDWATKTVYPDVVPYDPGYHLWSDGADKSRWIHLPPGQKVDTTNMDEWTFPVGTQIWKEFSLPLGGDGSAPTRIETRLLWKQAASTWYRTTYVWTPDGTSSATELTTGELDAGGVGYEVPTQYECDSCHNGRLDGVLGFEAVALSSSGATGLNMQALVAQGLLTAPPTAPLVVPGNATESAALAWLHMNCGTSCHTPNGVASFTGFTMRLDVATLASVQTTNAYLTGWNQITQQFYIPGVTQTYRIHACDLASSCVYYRASHRDGPGIGYGIQMPPLDTHKVDTADLATIAAWIDEGCDAGSAGDAGTD
jgi:hypothetical protein